MRGETFDLTFDMDIPDLQGLIRQLDMFDERQNAALMDALHQVGDNIVQAQRRHIAGVRVGKRLSKYITRSKVYTTKKGVLGVTAGYQFDAFEDDTYWGDKGTEPGVVGLTYEFGRPGQSNNTRRQDEYRYWHYHNKKGTLVAMKQRKGAIQPHPHIRLGFDETLEQNIQTLVNAVNAEIERLNRGE